MLLDWFMALGQGSVSCWQALLEMRIGAPVQSVRIASPQVMNRHIPLRNLHEIEPEMAFKRERCEATMGSYHFLTLLIARARLGG